METPNSCTWSDREIYTREQFFSAALSSKILLLWIKSACNRGFINSLNCSAIPLVVLSPSNALSRISVINSSYVFARPCTLFAKSESSIVSWSFAVVCIIPAASIVGLSLNPQLYKYLWIVMLRTTMHGSNSKWMTFLLWTLLTQLSLSQTTTGRMVLENILMNRTIQCPRMYERHHMKLSIGKYANANTIHTCKGLYTFCPKWVNEFIHVTIQLGT